VVVKGSEVGMGRVVPHLVVHDAAGAADFYRRAFGAQELCRFTRPDGPGLHIHLRIADSIVMVTDASEPRDPAGLDAHYRLLPPQALGGTTAVFQFYWPDGDAAYRRAVEAGAQPTVPPFNAFWGDRYGCVTDPYGHVWAIATQLEVLSAREVERGSQTMRQIQPRE
jgi:PhnB protein